MKYVLSYVINYERVSISFAIIIKVAFKEH